MPDFSHLHCHTHFSLLDGAARIKTLVGKAAAMEMPALAITDHGNLFGVPEFYTYAKKADVRPIIGCEFYVTPSGMHDKSDRTRYHQVLLAKNEEGYRNLIKLSSLSYTDGYYYKPRLDRETLRRHSAGLVATTCCLQGEVLQTILKRGEEEGLKIFKEYLDIFGEDYYIEIQDHGIPDQKRCNEVLLRWSREYGVKAIATNDVHYVEQTDAAAQDVLLCLQTGKDLMDPNRMRFENDQFYLKGIDEMRSAFPDLEAKVTDEALDTTREIVDKCDLELSMGTLLMPHYPIPEAFGQDMDAYLEHLVFERAKERYPQWTSEVQDRLVHELRIIKEMGYAGYFLIVQDFTTAARDLGVSVGPGRGSAAGSAVAYCLGITGIDPLKYELLFERFLNPERISMPDIDIDFDDRGRGKVIEYVVEKYGRQNVCQIITFGTMGARSVVRDVARVLGLPLAESDRIAKLIPEGPKVNLESALKDIAEFRALENDQNPQIRKLMHYAKVLEGSARHTGVHAAGVIIAPGDVSEYVPISIAKSKGDQVVTTQYDGKWVEDFGLLKMDFLGLKTLTVLNDALDLIKANRGIEIDLDTIPLDDEETFKLFQRGETVAIFQFESSGMREWMLKLKPTSLDDLIAMNALYRPGPMDLIPNYIDRKHGREDVQHPHPMLAEILEPTYGIPVYQEQVMQMAQTMAGYSLGQADILRRCVTGDTLVVNATTGERVRVDEVQVGMEILSLGPDFRLRAVPVQARFDNGTMPVYRVRTRSGRTIELTEEHPLLTVLGWRHLADLGVGDFVAVPTAVPICGTHAPDPARIKALAYLLGDGNTLRRDGYAQARFYNSDAEVLTDYRAAIASLGATTKTYRHAKTGVVSVTCATLPGQPNPVLNLVREAGLAHRAESKRMPPEVFGYDEPSLRLFLGTLWSTDGSVERTRLSYSSSSSELLDDVAHLLLRLGVVTMRRSRSTTHRPNYELIITDQRDVERFAEQIRAHLCSVKRERLGVLLQDVRARQRNQSVHNVPADVGHLVRTAKASCGLSWSQAGAQVGIAGNALSSGLNLRHPGRALSRHRLSALGMAFGDNALQQLACSDVLWDPIVEITPVGERPVYDLAVPPHANFVAADVVIHNSMGKKKQAEMDKQRVIFVEGAAKKDVSEATANEVFDMMAKFAGYGFNKCVIGETEIIDAETGARTSVGELFQSKRPFTIHALGDDLKLRPRRVTDVVWNGRKPVFELKTKLGKRIVTTGNHPFRTLEGWTNLENLCPGDRIAAPRALPVATEKSWPEHELVALAGLIAEGNTCHTSCLYFYGNDHVLVEDFAQSVGRFPNTKARIDERSGGRLEVCASTGRDVRFRRGQVPWNAGGVRVGANTTAAGVRSGAFQWAGRLGLLGKKATEKFVPPDVFTLCDADVALFLGRLWAGDGFIANATQFTPFYATSSERLARDVQTLLLRLGVVSRIHKKFKYRGDVRPGYTVHLLGEGSAEMFLETVAPHALGREAQVDLLRAYVQRTTRGLSSKDTVPADGRSWVDAERQDASLTWRALETESGVSMKEFYGNGSVGKRGFRRATVDQLAATLDSDRLADLATSDVFWDEVESITPRGTTDTYDLTVEGDHNFVADGLIVHNSHSAAYSVVAYQTAYLKAHFTPEFMAAAMTNEIGSTDKLAIVLEEARKLGLEMLPPSINHSQAHFTVENGKIRFGLGAIKGVGFGAIEAIVQAREKHGPSESLFAFVKELDVRAVGKKALECLAASGALDVLEGHRAQLAEAMDVAVQYAQKVQLDRAAGQNSLFGGGAAPGMSMEPNLPLTAPWPRSQLLKEERELIGVYVSGHPLEAFGAEAAAFATAQLGRVGEMGIGEENQQDERGYGRERGPSHRFCGILTDVQRRTTKSGKPIAFATIEDFTGQGEVVLFSSQFDKLQQYLNVDEVVLVRGNVEVRGGDVKIITQDIMPMWKVREQLVKSIVLRISLEQATTEEAEKLTRLRDLCDTHRGHCKLYFDLQAPDLPGGAQRIRSRSFVVDPTAELMQGITRLFGREAMYLEGEA